MYKSLIVLAAGGLVAATALAQTPVPVAPRPAPASGASPAVPLLPLPTPIPIPPSAPDVSRPPLNLMWAYSNTPATVVVDATDALLAVGTKATPAAVQDRADKLMALVTAFVEPATWKANGGRGSMVFFAENFSLVVVNEPRVANQVKALVAQLAAPRPGVAVSIVRMQCDPAALDRLGLRDRQLHQPIPLTTGRMDGFVLALKAAGACDVLAAPQLQTWDNQTGFVEIVQSAPAAVVLPAALGQFVATAQPAVPTEAAGMIFRATPRLMPDGKSILVRVATKFTERDPQPIRQAVGSPHELWAYNTETAEVTLTVPNGGTALVPMGTKTITSPVESKVPTLGDLPILNTLLRGAETQTRRWEEVLLVTAETPGEKPATGPGLVLAPTPVVTRPVPVAPPAAAPMTLVDAYRKACAEGRTEDAKKYALQAIAADPTCFGAK